MPSYAAVDPDLARRFAEETVRQLRDAGFQALWAGGCVRDRLMGLAPKDYDVATDATPRQVRRVFANRRTLAIGEAFGVVMLPGGPGAGQIEIATFRCDAPYSDGRHPDAVTFSSPEEDAQRRDFTINGLFYDPVERRVIDYVGGREDLRAGILRAIGRPEARLAEDKLRMLRAARFSTTLGFPLESETSAAIVRHCGELGVVSAERIAAEMRRLLSHPNRAFGVELLYRLGLLPVVLPEAAVLNAPDGPKWQRTLDVLGRLPATDESALPVPLAGLLWQAGSDEAMPEAAARGVCRRWRLSNDETRRTAWLLAHEGVVRRAPAIAWPRLQRVLIEPDIEPLLELARAIATVAEGNVEAIEYCRDRLRLPPEQLDPPPLLTGDGLIAAGFVPGKHFREILLAVRDAQLDGKITTADEALDLAGRIAR